MAKGFPHTRSFQLFNGVWGARDLPWVACSSTYCHLPEKKFLIVSENGDVKTLGGGQTTDEQIITHGIGPRTRGPLIEIRTVAGGHAYAVGTARQAYRRYAANVWARIDQGAQTKRVDLADTCFHSVDGFNETDMYTVGWEGEIWHYDGNSWSQLASPTNLALYKVLCAPDGNVYACGQIGLLLRGQRGRWEVLDQEDTKEDLWDLAWLNDRLYTSSLHFVFELNDDRLQLSYMGDTRPPSTCHQLSAADGLLWSIGAKDVMQFDGQRWSRIV